MEETEEEATAKRLAMAETDRQREMAQTEEEVASRTYEDPLRAQHRLHDDHTQPLVVRENNLQAIARCGIMNSTNNIGSCKLHPTIYEQQTRNMENAFLSMQRRNQRNLYSVLSQ